MIKKFLFIIILFLITTNSFATNISNADIDDEDMADITDWTDEDAGTGDSSQVTFDSKSCMKLDSGASTTPAGIAKRYQDIGSYGTRTVVSFSLYCDAIGTFDNTDGVRFITRDATHSLYATFASDGLFIFSGAAYVEVGTDIVVQDTWQEWTFDIDWSAVTVDVYLDKVLVGSDLAINWHSGSDGQCHFECDGVTTTSRIAYVNWFKAGSDFVVDETRHEIFIVQ